MHEGYSLLVRSRSDLLKHEGLKPLPWWMKKKGEGNRNLFRLVTPRFTGSVRSNERKVLAWARGWMPAAPGPVGTARVTAGWAAYRKVA